MNEVLQSPRLTNEFGYYVPESKEVTLNDHKDHIQLRFAAMNYQLQHRVHYQYMLEGYDKDWHNADNDRTATYQGLPTGYLYLRGAGLPTGVAGEEEPTSKD